MTEMNVESVHERGNAVSQQNCQLSHEVASCRLYDVWKPGRDNIAA